MSKIDVILPVPREVTIESAKSRIQGMFSKMMNESKGMITDLSESWNGYTNNFSFKAKGRLVTGRAIVGHNTVDITANLPFFLGFFKDQITQKIWDEGVLALKV